MKDREAYASLWPPTSGGEGGEEGIGQPHIVGKIKRDFQNGIPKRSSPLVRPLQPDHPHRDVLPEDVELLRGSSQNIVNDTTEISFTISEGSNPHTLFTGMTSFRHNDGIKKYSL